MTGVGPARTVRELCLGILEGGTLEDKLASPTTSNGALLADEDPGPPLLVDAPVRAPELRLVAGSSRLPRLHELREPAARRACLSRFAHHELMAVELFAWALLAWPDAPSGLRSGLLSALADEQRHLRLYVERLRAHGSDLGDEPLSDYFWKHVPALAASPHGPLAFLAAMGLTLEQANLDFTLLWRDAFRRAGDEETARVVDLVHREEIAHVRLAADWHRRLRDPAWSDVDGYERTVPFPLAAARAKGRRFDVPARRRAGLSEEMIDHVRRASPRPADPKGST